MTAKRKPAQDDTRTTVILGEAESDVAARSDGGARDRSEILRRMVGRYAECCRRSMPALSLDEWRLVVDSLNGSLHEPHSVGFAPHGIADSIALDGLAEKWGVDGAALMARLKELDYAGCLAIVDTAERFWSAVSREAPQKMQDQILEEAVRLGRRQR